MKKIFALLSLGAFVLAVGCNEPAKTSTKSGGGPTTTGPSTPTAHSTPTTKAGATEETKKETKKEETKKETKKEDKKEEK